MPGMARGQNRVKAWKIARGLRFGGDAERIGVASNQPHGRHGHESPRAWVFGEEGPFRGLSQLQHSGSSRATNAACIRR